jgi:DNA-binding NarL/FixJ family response regulator
MAINVCVIEGPARVAPRETLLARRLAPRELEVLHLLSTGRPYKQIADELELSMGTIRTYIRRLYGKLHVNCRTEAVVKYLVP